MKAAPQYENRSVCLDRSTDSLKLAIAAENFVMLSIICLLASGGGGKPFRSLFPLDNWMVLTIASGHHHEMHEIEKEVFLLALYFRRVRLRRP